MFMALLRRVYLIPTVQGQIDKRKCRNTQFEEENFTSKYLNLIGFDNNHIFHEYIHLVLITPSNTRKVFNLRGHNVDRVGPRKLNRC